MTTDQAPQGVHQGPLRVRRAGAWIPLDDVTQTKTNQVLLDITTEGGVSFHVSTPLGRDERVGKVDGKLEGLTIPVSDGSKAFCQR